MKICPQCRTTYEEDYLFCLSDGNALIADSTEQETVVNPARGFTIPIGGGTPDHSGSCPACGLENKSDSKFCKKCGTVINATSFASGLPPTQYAQHVPPQGQAYGSPIPFATPVYSTPAQPPAPVSSPYKTVAIISLAAVSLLLLAGLIFLIGTGGPKTDDTNKRSNNVKTDSNSNSAINVSTPSNNANVKRSTSPTPDNRPADNTQSDDNWHRKYEGYSNTRLTLVLNRNGSSLSGSAVTPGDVDYLQGSIDADGNFDMAGDNKGTGVTGQWRGVDSSTGKITGARAGNKGEQGNVFNHK